MKQTLFTKAKGRAVNFTPLFQWRHSCFSQYLLAKAVHQSNLSITLEF